MATKLLSVPNVGTVTFYKHPKSKNIRIHINGTIIKVTLPKWMPYKIAVAYVSQKSNWINNHKKDLLKLSNGSKIGKFHILVVNKIDSTRFRSIVTNNQTIVYVPNSASEAVTQKRLHEYCLKTLQIESEEYLIPRTRRLAENNGFDVKSITIENTKSRWGSCSSKQDIALSLYLIQLPWEQIDYVIFHELAHTIHLNHSTAFWNLVKRHVPNYKSIKAVMKQYSPNIMVR